MQTPARLQAPHRRNRAAAASLQRVAVLLRAEPSLRPKLEATGTRVRNFSGEVSLLVRTSPDAAQKFGKGAGFDQAGDADQTMIIVNMEHFEHERYRLPSLTYAELENFETNTKRWLPLLTSAETRSKRRR